MATSRLGLTTPAGTDAINLGDNAITANANILDNAAMYQSGTFAARPLANAVVAGTLYRPSDFAGHVFISDGTVWHDMAERPTVVSSLPGSPFDGQEIYFQADATNGVLWHFRYNAGSASTYKWEAVNGAPMIAQQAVGNIIITASSTYVDDAGTPSLTVPLAGDYAITISSYMGCQTNCQLAGIGLKIGAAAVATGDELVKDSDGSTTLREGDSGSRVMRRTIATAATILKFQYKNSSTGSARFERGSIAVAPVRVG